MRAFKSFITMTLACGLTVLAAQTPVPAPVPRPGGAPRLLVVLVVDQFRADYIEWYGKQWTKGLRRLLDRGAVYTNAAYPYAATLTCAGHATIATGAFPAVHGMSGNEFYDRALRRLLPCVLDPAVTSVAFGGATGRERYSARSLLVPTFGEEIRRLSRLQTRIVALALKPRSAVTLAGRGNPDTTAIFEEDDGTWATSDAYTATPWPDADAFVRAQPMKAKYGAVWNRLLPLASYQFTDAAPGEAKPAPWTEVFPHPLISAKGVPDNEFVTAWERSPWSDEFLADLAIHLLRARRLGAGSGTDVLTVSLPSLDLIGHEFGPRSHEVQDVLARVDVQIGRLLDALDELVGQSYAVGLTADHGVSLVPEQVVAEGGDAGRISSTGVRDAVNVAVERALGKPGPHVAAIYESQIALNPGVADLLRRKPGSARAITSAITRIRGIAFAHSADEIIDGEDSTNTSIKAWRLSYVPGRSGDFFFTPKPNWIMRGTSGATHGSLNRYDQRVPLVLYGARIRSGRYAGAATPADLAPTLAHLIGVTLPRAQGRPLVEAVVR